MKKITHTKAEKQNWQPLNKVADVRVCVKNVKGTRVTVANSNTSRRVIA